MEEKLVWYLVVVEMEVQRHAECPMFTCKEKQTHWKAMKIQKRTVVL